MSHIKQTETELSDVSKTYCSQGVSIKKVSLFFGFLAVS